MTDNRTNEPTPEQVEAAAIAFTCETHDEWERSPEPYKEMIREDMRAVLVAAQGAAPQDPERIMLHHPDGTPKSNDEIRSEAAAVREGAAPQAERDWRLDVVPEPWTDPAPVLPSSGVDEDKLAEVIRKLRFNDAGCMDDGIDCTESVSDHADDIARAVAEWLKGQGR